MSTTIVRGALAALAVAVAALFGPAMDLGDPWPVLLVLAVVLVPGGTSIGRVGAVVFGTLLAWVAMALQAAVLPSTAMSTVLLGIGSVTILVAVAVVSAERIPLWAGLAGLGTFTGFYLPTFEATPTAFLAESPVALVSVLLATGVAALAGTVADLLTPGEAAAVARPGLAPPPEDLQIIHRIPDATEEVR